MYFAPGLVITVVKFYYDTFNLPEQFTPMKLVLVQSQVYLSGEEPNTQVPLLAQGVLATHVSLRIHEHREEFNVYPGPQTVAQTIERENCHYCSKNIS